MRSRIDWVRLALSVAGLLISAYLTAVHYDAHVPLVCKASGIINCEQVLTSPQSVLAGLPIAVWGLVWFAVSIALWWWNASAVPRARLAWTVAGTAGVLYFIYLEFLVIGSVCLWCSATHLIVLTLLTIEVLQQPGYQEEPDR